MASKFVVITLLAICAVQAQVAQETSLETAKTRIYKDFMKNLYNKVQEVQVSTVYNMLRLYTHSTLEQTYQVVEYIESHSNLSRAESSSLRMANNASPEIAECIQKGELNLLQAFRSTGYNLHNCIRSAQVNYEKMFTDQSAKLEVLKAKVVTTYKQFSSILDNCVDSDCIMKTLIQSIIRYEALKEELAQEETAGNNLNSRYIVTSIAMGCVASSMQQIHHNYNVGKELMSGCFHAKLSRAQNGTMYSHS